MNNFETVLLKYLDDKNPEPLECLLRSPNQIIESNSLAKDSLLVTEAVIILDALNFYNNNTSQFSKEEELINISESSPLFSWRCGVLAIKEFYNENNIKVTEYINDIRECSPVKNIGKFLRESKKETLYSKNKKINNSVNTLKQVINNSLVDIYPSSVKILLNELQNENIKNIEDIILTIIKESLENIPLDVIHQSLIKNIGITEATRLMALGTIFDFPIKGIQYLFIYFTLKKYTSKNDENLQALIMIISDVLKNLIEKGYKFESKQKRDLFLIDSTLFINNLKSFFDIKYKNSKDPLINLKRALDISFKKDNILKEKPLNIQGELF